MIGVLVLAALLTAWTPPDAVDTGARIGAAMAAEQRLQGPLDGGWTLRDDAGRPLYRFELVDPAGGRGPLTGAWRDPGGGAGVIADARRGGRTLRIDFAPAGGEPTALRLTERSPRLWTGRMIAGATRRAVVLRRD
jgi:hypothetical protein